MLYAPHLKATMCPMCEFSLIFQDRRNL